MADGIVAAGEYTLGLAGAHEMPGMADGISTGGTRVGDDGRGALETEGLGKIKCLALRLVMAHTGGLMAIALRLADGLTVVGFPQAHPATGRTHDERQMFRRFPPALSPCLAGGQK